MRNHPKAKVSAKTVRIVYPRYGWVVIVRFAFIGLGFYLGDHKDKIGAQIFFAGLLLAQLFPYASAEETTETGHTDAPNQSNKV